MNKTIKAVPITETDKETTEEIIGVLTAISVVSKRMAKKLTLLEQQTVGKEGEQPDVRGKPQSAHAD